MTPRQRRFAEEYLIDLNAAQAAIRAGYSPDSARSVGPETLSNPAVAELVTRLQRERSERVRVSADDVLRELKRVGFSRMAEFASWGPEGVALRPSKEIPADAAACVAEVSQTVSQGGGSIKFKLHSKTQALELIGKHLGMFRDVHEHTFPDGVPVTPEQAAQARREAEEYRRQREARVNGSARNGHAPAP